MGPDEIDADERLAVLSSSELDHRTLAGLHELWAAAFGGRFTSEDARHAFGGVHVVARDGDRVVGHASAVPRTLVVAERSFRAGYVEAVATLPGQQRHGVGTRVMRRLDEEIRHRFEIGALSTGHGDFYQRLGWERWRGPTYVVRDGVRHRTVDEDDGVMVLRFGVSATVGLASPIACHDRPGDAW